MSEILASLKLGIVVFLILLYMLASAFLELIPLSRWQRVKWRATIGSKFSQLALKILGVEVYNFGSLSDRSRGHLQVSNHLSYLDVLILAAQRPSCFVTSVEVRETPFLGWLCRLGGCLFVERRSRSRLENEIAEITDALKHGLNVVVFPEATSTNGEDVLRFRRPLFNASIQSGSLVAPTCIFYESINGEPFSIENRDLVCWYGEMDFLGHLYKLCELNFLMVCLTYFGEISRTSAEDLAEVSHQLVRSEYLKQKNYGAVLPVVSYANDLRFNG